MDGKDNNLKRTYTKLSFSQEDEEKIINFVKTNAELYDPKNGNFKNKSHKDKLWCEFAKSLNNDTSGWKLIPYYRSRFYISFLNSIF